MKRPLLQIRNLHRIYQQGDNSISALDGLSLDIEEGEFVAIMGASGSGKSTLMNILGGLDAPTHGTYHFEDLDLTELSNAKIADMRCQNFGFIFQSYNLLPTLSALDNVAMPVFYRRDAKGYSERYKRAEILLTALHLEERKYHKPAQLSGGEQQRVALARALINDAKVILADEPTGALDNKTSIQIMTFFRMLNRDQGRTIVLVTHDEEVASYADRIIHLADGCILSDQKNENKKVDCEPPHIVKIQDQVVTARRFKPWDRLLSLTKISASALYDNRLRTGLTLLGIIIGITAVMTLLAVGEGSKQRILEQIEQMGSNLLTIYPGGTDVAEGRGFADFTLETADALRDVSHVQHVLTNISVSATVRAGRYDERLTIEGTSAEFPMARNWDIAEGEFFNKQDIKNQATVAVLGHSAAETLFPNAPTPLGEYIFVRNIPLEIIGVMVPKGLTSWGQDQDNVVWVPITTAINRIERLNAVHNIQLSVEDRSLIPRVKEKATQSLIAYRGSQDFEIHNTAAFLRASQDAQKSLTWLLSSIAGISLLVGGISVMNIMLVSVSERTREIGLRMATGANRNDIRSQFLVESAFVCLIGGVLGILCGIICSFILASSGIDIVVTVWPAILAFSIAFLIGLIFGFLPANKAAMMDPVKALARF